MAVERYHGLLATGEVPQLHLPQITSESPEVISSLEWPQLPVIERVKAENTAVLEMFSQSRDPLYAEAIRDTSQAIPVLDAHTKVGVVVPAYNEAENMPLFLASLATQKETADPATWSVLVVLNRPDVRSEKATSDEANLQKTADLIDTFSNEHPDIQISYVTARPPAAIAGVGLARMVGHDISMMRSMQRPEEERTGTFYLQTLDADTELDPEYMKKVVEAAESSADQYDLIRQRGSFSKEDKLRYPLLNVLEPMWNETFSAISKRTDNPWSIGRGMLMQTYVHAKAGGPFGRKLPAPDEDIRMGMHVLHTRPDNTTIGEMTDPVFVSNARREITILASLKVAMADHPGKYTREMQEIARTLRSYLGFHDDAIRENEHALVNTSWLESQEAFGQEISNAEVAVFLNSWWCMARTEYALYYLKQSIPQVNDLYEQFKRGEIPYPMMQQEFNALEDELYKTNKSKALVEGLEKANNHATEDMATIAEKYGIEVTTQKVDIEPLPMDPQAEMYRPLQVTSTDAFREKLRTELVLQ